jgi:cold shock CspA family protein
VIGTRRFLDAEIPSKNIQNSSEAIMKGFVDYWKKEKGYGFIVDSASGARYFAHIYNFEVGALPETGNLVEFTPGMSARGLVATSIRLLTAPETIAAMLALAAQDVKS